MLVALVFKDKMWTFLKLLPQKNDILAPDEGRTSNLVLADETFQPSSYQDLSGGLKVLVQHTPPRHGSNDRLIMLSNEMSFT